MPREVHSPSIYLQLSSVTAPSGNSFPGLYIHPTVANILLLLRVIMPPPTFLIQTSWPFLGWVRITFLWLSERELCVISASAKSSGPGSKPLKSPSHNASTHCGSTVLPLYLVKRYFISLSCFSLLSQLQSHLLPCNITSDTFPIIRLFIACCRSFS